MRIGLLVDGQAEYYSLPLLIHRINTNAIILDPLYCDMQPFATAAQIAHAAAKRARIILDRNISVLVLVIDREGREECPPQIALEIKRELEKRLSSVAPRTNLEVVLKVNTFENWLIADPDALKQLRGVFEHPERITKAVIPNKADNVPAMQLLKSSTYPSTFNKIKLAKAICEVLDADRAAENSRSLRRLLRVLGHPDYRQQSRRPIIRN